MQPHTSVKSNVGTAISGERVIYCADGFHGGSAVYPCALDTLMSRLAKVHADLPRYRFYLELDGYAFEDMRRNPGTARGVIVQGLEEEWIELVNGAYTQPFCEAIGLESNILQLQWGKQLARDVFNVEITTYLVQEHAFHAALPQILDKLGYDLVVMRTHWPIFGQHPVYSSEAVHWQGLDGSRILTIPHYSFCHFGRVPESYPALRSWLADSGWRAPSEEYIETWLRECSSLGIDHPFATRLPDFVNGGIFPESVIGSMLDDPRLTFVLPKQFGRILREQGSSARPIEAFDPDTMDTHLPYGLQGDRMIAACKQLESRLSAVGILSSFAYIAASRQASGDSFSFGGPNHYADDLRFVWKRLMLAQQHDIWVCGASSRGGYSLEQRGAAWIKEAAVLCDGIEKECMMQLLYMQEQAFSPETVGVVVFNPLSWSRSDLVRMTVTLPPGNFSETGIVDSEGNPVACQISEARKDATGTLAEVTIGFVARDVPPCGYRLFYVVNRAHHVRSSLSVGDDLVENGVFALRIGPQGIVSLVLTETGTAVIDAPQGAARLVAISGDKGEMIDTGALPAQSMCLERGPVYARYKISGGNELFSFSKLVTVYDNSPRIDIEDTLHLDQEAYIGHHTDEPALQSVEDRSKYVGWHTDAFIDNEKLRCVVPVRCKSGTVRRNVVYAGVETHRRTFTAHDWADVSDDMHGLAIINRGNLRYVHDAPRGELSLVLGYSGTYVFSAGPEYHSMRGEYRFKYALYPHGAFSPIVVSRAAQEANSPMLVDYWKGGPRRSRKRAADQNKSPPERRQAQAPHCCSLLRLRDCSVEVSSVELVEERLLIRLCEIAGKDAEVVLTCFGQVIHAGVVDLQGNALPQGQLPLIHEKNEIKLRMKAFGIETILVTLAKADGDVSGNQLRQNTRSAPAESPIPDRG